MKPGYERFPIGAAKGIAMLILDVDGVLTDGRIILGDQGEEYKGFNVRDGHGVKMLQRCGIRVGILTGRTSGVVERRARELGIEDVVQGSLNKSEGLNTLLAQAGVAAAACAYMGDDVVDLPAMRRCHLGLAPHDAHAAVIGVAHWVADYRGGNGAVRQAAEGLILASGNWGRVMEQPYGVSNADAGWHL
ncbi:MAG: HAD-IIIA family hydrolase [Mariprofundaceae bacterium]